MSHPRCLPLSSSAWLRRLVSSSSSTSATTTSRRQRFRVAMLHLTPSPSPGGRQVSTRSTSATSAPPSPPPISRSSSASLARPKSACHSTPTAGTRDLPLACTRTRRSRAMPSGCLMGLCSEASRCGRATRVGAQGSPLTEIADTIRYEFFTHRLNMLVPVVYMRR